MKKRIKKWSIVLLVLGVLSEFILRFGLGLGQVPAFVQDDDYEYIYAPNLDVVRFGNRFQTNAESMRSKALSKNDKVRILKFGDSILSGGAHVDQDSVVSSRAEIALQQTFHDSIRVLNVSAASWGVDNAFEYLKKHGDFDAKMIVLIFSSHDYHDNRHFQEVVGKHASWPADQPLLAITDAWRKYIWPKITATVSDAYEETYLKGIDDSPVNSGWQNFAAYAADHNIELLVYLHPEKEETANNAYNSNGIHLLALLSENNVNVVQGLKSGLTADDYRDHIHLNNSGHRKMSAALLPYLQQHVEAQLAENNPQH